MNQSEAITSPPSKALQICLSIYVCFPLLHLSIASSQEEGGWKMPALLLTTLLWLAVSSFLFHEYSTGYLKRHGQEIVISVVFLILLLNSPLFLGIRVDLMSMVMLSVVLATISPRIRLDFIECTHAEVSGQNSV